MKGWETALVYGGSGAAGYVANKLITIPFSVGNKLGDAIIDASIGVAVMVVGFHINHEAGVLLAIGGAGWIAGAATSYAGIA